jgi:nitroreductase
MENSSMLDKILERTSIRSFEKDKKIPEEFEKKILLAGIRAPSAGNIQPRTIIVAKDEVVKDQLYQLCEGQAFMKAAPLWIVMCVDLHRHLKAAKLTGVKYDYTGILPYTLSVLDASLSLENMVIAAEAFGLGSVMIGSVIEHPEEARNILKLPEHCLAFCVLCVGYPKRKFGTREKWDYRVIVCEDHYKDIDATDVTEYWKKLMLNDLKRGGKEISPEIIERICNERNYGKSYASHYKEDFVSATNRKLNEFLKKQGLLKD